MENNNNTLPVNPDGETPLEKKKSSKKLLLVTIGLIVVGLFATFVILVNNSASENILTALPQIPNLSGKSESFVQHLLSADKQARNALSSDRDLKKFGQKTGQLGELYQANEFFDQANECYEIASRFDPRNPLWPHHLAFLAQTMGQNELAQKLLERTIELTPDYYPSLLKLADIYYKTQKIEKAKTAYEKCLKLAPENPYALLGLGRIELDNSNWLKAQDYLQRTIKADQKFGSAYRWLALIHEHFGRTKQMQKTRDIANSYGRFVSNADQWVVNIDLQCYDSKRLTSLYDNALQMRRVEIAEQFFQRALTLDPQNAKLYFIRGTFFLKAKRLTASQKALEKAIELDPNSAPYFRKLALALLEQNKLKPAEQMFLRSLELDLECPFTMYYNMGSIYLRTKRYEKAIYFYKKGAENDPKIERVYYTIGLCYQKLGQLDKAIEYWEKELQAKYDNPLVHYNMAGAYTKTGKIDLAIKHYNKVKKLKPNHFNSYVNLAQLFFERGDTAQAIDHYQIALKLKPNNIDALNALGWILATTEDENFSNPSKAVQYAEKACEITNFQNPLLLDTLSVSYAARGNFKDAIETSEKALEFAKSANNPDLIKELDERIRLYKAKKPYKQKQ
ncbi:MAG: tetratricopeptide repeat protein [Planctomycetes bacterium]|nr:tetratricopeptide repeat protein [Planctomycetota bacterium]